HECCACACASHRPLEDHAHRLRRYTRLRETPRVTRGLALIFVTLAGAAPASAAVRGVASLPPERYARSGAIGLAVPGAGPTVTRDAALRTLLTGNVASSLIGGPLAGRTLIP